MKRGLEMPADVGNRLFPALMMPTKLSQAGSREEVLVGLKTVARGIAALTRKAVGMDWLHLRRARSVRAISSGGNKLPGLFTILLAARSDVLRARGNGFNIDHAPIISELTTDYETATVLLQAVEAVQADEELNSWYERALSEIGLAG